MKKPEPNKKPGPGSVMILHSRIKIRLKLMRGKFIFIQAVGCSALGWG
jgi:hypothetical protein